MASDWRLRRLAAQQQSKPGTLPKRSSSMRKAFNYLTGKKAIETTSHSPYQSRQEPSDEAKIQTLERDLALCRKQLAEANGLLKDQDLKMEAIDQRALQLEKDYRKKEAALLESRAAVEEGLAQELADRIREARVHERKLVETELQGPMEAEQRKYKVRIASMAEELHASKVTAERLKISYDDHVDALEAQLDVRNAECQSIQSTLAESSSTLKGLTAAHQDLLKEMEGVKEAKSALKLATSTHIAALENEIMQWKSKMDAATVDREELLQQHLTIKTELEVMSKEQDQLLVFQSEAETELNKCRGEVADLNVEICKYATQQALIETMKENIATLNNDLSSKVAQVAELEKAIDLHKARINDFDQQASALAQLSAVLKDNEKSLEIVQEQKKQLKSQHAEAQTKIQNLISTNEANATKLSELERDNAAITEDLAVARSSLVSLEAKATSLESIESDRQQQLTASNAEKMSLEAVITDVRVQLANMKEALETAQTHTAALQNESNMLLSEKDLLNDKLGTMAESEISYKDQLSKLQDELNSAKLEIRQNADILGEAQQNAKIANDALDTAKAELQQKVNDAEAQSRASLEQLTNIQQQNEQTSAEQKHKVLTLTTENLEMTNRLQSTEERFSSLEATHAAAELHIKDLEAEVESLQSTSTTTGMNAGRELVVDDQGLGATSKEVVITSPAAEVTTETNKHKKEMVSELKALLVDDQVAALNKAKELFSSRKINGESVSEIEDGSKEGKKDSEIDMPKMMNGHKDENNESAENKGLDRANETDEITNILGVDPQPDTHAVNEQM